MSGFTSYGRQDLFETTLSSSINSSTTSITVQNTVAFSLSSGTFYAVIDPDGETPEVVQVSGVSSTTWTVTRGIPLSEGGPSSAAEHAGGVKIIISNNWKTYSDIATAITSKIDKAGGTFTGPVLFSGASTTFRLPNLTTVERDALASPANGMKIYNTTSGTEQVYSGGSWADNSTGATPNGSETVSGSYELATVAQQGSATSTGETGARLVPANSNLVKTSSGSGDENKIAVLDSSGKYAAGFIPTGTDDTKIANAIIAAKGDLIAGSANDTPAILSASANEKVVTYNSSESTGLKGTHRNRRLATNLSATTVGNTAVETALITTTVPGAILETANGIAGRLYITDYDQTTVRSLTLRLKYGSTTLATLTLSAPASAVSNWGGVIDFTFFNNAASNAQVAALSVALSVNTVQVDLAGKAHYSRVATGSGTENSTGDLTLQVTAQWDGAATGATLTSSLGFIHTIAS